MPPLTRPLPLLIALLCSSACDEPTPEKPDVHTPMLLSMNDVSVLYPMPPAEGAVYLLPTDIGSYGELFPQALSDEIPVFGVTSDDMLVYTMLQVVSLRFDPCGGSPEACQPEVRLVMQPISRDGRARDTALHLFYSIDDFAAVVDALRELRTLEPETAVSGPLEVHPSLLAQGVNGAYGTALRDLVLSLTGVDRLRRITFFLRAPSTIPNWFLGGFEVENGELTTLKIEGVRDDVQQVILDVSADAYTYQVSPAGISVEDGSAFLSSEAMAAATDTERQESFASYLRVENPTIYVPDQLSCVGCHLSTFVTAYAEREYGLMAAAFPEDGYSSTTRDLQLSSGAAAEPTSLRALGWFDFDPMISRRTVNDTAQVLDSIEADYPDLR